MNSESISAPTGVGGLRLAFTQRKVLNKPDASTHIIISFQDLMFDELPGHQLQRGPLSRHSFLRFDGGDETDIFDLPMRSWELRPTTPSSEKEPI